MRWNRVPHLLLPLALAGALVAVGGADDAKSADKAVIKMPGLAAAGVLDGAHFYAIADSRLVDVDLKDGRVKRVDELEAALRPYLDVSDGRACVASEAGLHIIALSSGKTTHSALYKGEVHGLGFAGDNRVFVVSRRGVKVIDAATCETVKDVPILNDEPNGRPARALGAFQRVGQLLYVADAEQRCVQVVDLKAGKLLDPMARGYDWITGLQVIGDKAFVRAAQNSYGIYLPKLGWYDLKTKKYTDLKTPKHGFGDRFNEEQLDQLTLTAGPDSGVCQASGGKVYQYDGDGRLVGETPLAKGDDGRLVGVWNDQALTAGKDGLRLTPLVKATAKGE